MAGKCCLKKGDYFNYLTVVSHHSREKGYNCVCACGNKTIVKTHALKTGKSKSCGCMQEKFRAERVAKNDFKGIKNNIYYNYSKAAERRKYIFELDKQTFFKLITSNCKYCGAKPNMTYTWGAGISETDYSQFKYNGVDRVDNTVGYTLDNCVSCCKICNNSKATLTLDEWKDWIERVHKYLIK